MGPLDRVAATASLVRALRDTRIGVGDVPDRGALLEVQRLADRSGGLARLVAELMPSYTGVPLGSARTGRDGGEGGRPGTGATAAAERLFVGAELTAARTALRVATAAGGDAIRTAMRSLEQLASDVGAVRDPSARRSHGLGMAEVWSRAVDGQGELQVSPDGSIAWFGRDVDPERLPVAVLRLQHRHGVVHGRLGGSSEWRADGLRVANWHRARLIGATTLDFLRRFMDVVSEPSAVADRGLLEAGRSVGIGPDQVARAVPVLRETVPNAVDAWRETDWGRSGPTGVGVPAGSRHARRVPDPLGVIYALADLVAAETLMSNR